MSGADLICGLAFLHGAANYQPWVFSRDDSSSPAEVLRRGLALSQHEPAFWLGDRGEGIVTEVDRLRLEHDPEVQVEL